MRRKQQAKTPTRRKRGRPRGEKGAVGRETIIAAARQLLEKNLPHRVTIALIARQAGVDPALVRYYFSNRDHLMLAVIEQLIADGDPRPSSDLTPAQQLSTYLDNMFRFSTRVRSMQRLMVEEGASAKTPEVRARVRELNTQAVNHIAGLLRVGPTDNGAPPEAVFLYVAVIALCEFFAAAQPMIMPLAPKGTSSTEFARQYEGFIRKLLLDGLKSRLKPARAASRRAVSRSRAAPR